MEPIGSFKALARLEYELQPEFIIGIDEVGYGAWAGPLTVGGVILPRGWSHELVKDSKSLSAKKREVAYRLIDKNAEAWLVKDFSPAEVDKKRVWPALKQLTEMVASELIKAVEGASFVLVHDGEDPIEIEALNRNNHIFFPKADVHVPAVSAASIMAKVTRDFDMINYHEGWPQYDWVNNKGYGVSKHVEALQRRGPCVLHRQSYKPVADVIAMGRVV